MHTPVSPESCVPSASGFPSSPASRAHRNTLYPAIAWLPRFAEDPTDISRPASRTRTHRNPEHGESGRSHQAHHAGHLHRADERNRRRDFAAPRHGRLTSHVRRYHSSQLRRCRRACGCRQRHDKGGAHGAVWKRSGFSCASRETNSFSQSCGLMDMPRGTVSRTIQSLEEQLGVPAAEPQYAAGRADRVRPHLLRALCADPQRSLRSPKPISRTSSHGPAARCGEDTSGTIARALIIPVARRVLPEVS